MKKLLGWLLTPVFVFVWILVLNLFHVVQVVAFRLFGQRAHQRAVGWLNGTLMFALRLLGTHAHVRFAADLPSGRPLIFVANHQSTLDIVGLSWYLRRYAPKFVSKKVLGRGIPSVSYNLRHGGSALIDRADPRQSLREIGRLGELIERSCGSAVIFPEGTRSRTGEMAPFQTAGIKTLLKKAPSALVVPVYIHDSWTLNRYGKFPLSVGESPCWTVLPGIETAGRTADQIVEEAEACLHVEQDRYRQAAQPLQA